MSMENVMSMLNQGVTLMSTKGLSSMAKNSGMPIA
jgi:hypothetical protein